MTLSTTCRRCGAEVEPDRDRDPCRDVAPLPRPPHRRGTGGSAGADARVQGVHLEPGVA